MVSYSYNRSMFFIRRNYCVSYLYRANGNTHNKTYLECFPTCSFFRLQRKIKTCVPKRRIKKLSNCYFFKLLWMKSIITSSGVPGPKLPFIPFSSKSLLSLPGITPPPIKRISLTPCSFKTVATLGNNVR